MKKLMKTLTVLMCAVALVAGSVAGTFAWLTAKTDPITNTFTAGNINITLLDADFSELIREKDFKMVPGLEIFKNPTVTVQGGSEDCWLFVKVEKKNNFGTFFDALAIAEGWTALEDSGGVSVYFREVTSDEDDQSFEFLANKMIKAREDCTKAQYDAIGANTPSLVFTAYAVQKTACATAELAWEEAEKLDQSGT